MQQVKMKRQISNHENGLLKILDTHVIISITDTMGRLVHVNNNFCKMVGYEKQDLIGETLTLIKSQLHTDPLYKNLWETITKGEVWKGVLSNQSSFGKLYWLETTITPQKNCAGEIEKYVATYVDITECYEDKNRYKETVSKLNRFTQSIPNTTISVNRLGEILSLNKGLGVLKIDETIGKPLYNFINPAYHKKIRNKIRLVFNQGKSSQFETIEYDSRGSQIVQISSIGPVYNKRGEVISATISRQDVKNVDEINIGLKVNEARYHTIFKSMDVGIIVVANENGDIIEWNKGAELAFGYTEQEILGCQLSYLISQKHKRQSNKELLNAVKTMKRKGAKSAIEVYGVKKNGVEFPLEFALSKWKINKEAFYCVMMLDITTRKALEIKLKEKTKELKLFLYRSAHDLKAPFSSAEGLLGLVKQEKLSKEVSDLIEMLNVTLDRGKQLTDNLSLASIITKKKRRGSLINFEELISDRINSFVGTKNYDTIKFEVSITGNEKFYSIDDLLISLFQNLIQNAIKYSDSQNESVESMIKIDVKTTTEGASISVKDNGHGICGNHINKIFDLYYRANINEVSGSGLGLYIVKNIVNDLKGTVKATSTPADGTSFIIDLPHYKACRK